MDCGKAEKCRLSDIGDGGEFCSVFAKKGFTACCRRIEKEKCLGTGLQQRDSEGMDTGINRLLVLYGKILEGIQREVNGHCFLS